MRRSFLIKAICYHNTKITLPNLVPNSRLNEECPLGFAYEDGDFYVHMYGRGEGLYTIFPGLTVMEGKKWNFIDTVGGRSIRCGKYSIHV